MTRWAHLIATTVSLLIIAAVIWFIWWENRRATRPDTSHTPEGNLARLIASIFAAHLIASYPVMLAAWLFTIARGAGPGALAWTVALAPLQVPIWLFLVTPLVLLEPTGRVSVAPLGRHSQRSRGPRRVHPLLHPLLHRLPLHPPPPPPLPPPSHGPMPTLRLRSPRHGRQMPRMRSRFQNDTHMKRRVFIILAASSLLLSLATVAVWVRSIWRADFIIRTEWWIRGERAGHSRIWVRSNDGLLTLGYFARSYPADAAGWPENRARTPEYRWDVDIARDASPSTRLGFDAKSQRTPALTYWGHAGYDVNSSLSMPYWFVALAFGFAPLAWLLTCRRSRGEPNLCPICNYDLRATPNQCPECGHTPHERT